MGLFNKKPVTPLPLPPQESKITALPEYNDEDEQEAVASAVEEPSIEEEEQFEEEMPEEETYDDSVAYPQSQPRTQQRQPLTPPIRRVPPKRQPQVRRPQPVAQQQVDDSQERLAVYLHSVEDRLKLIDGRVTKIEAALFKVLNY